MTENEIDKGCAAMTRIDSFTGDPDDLRRRADEKLLENPALIQETTEELTKLDRIVHELKVHQIELEMQNEELRRAQHELEETRDKYIDLYDFSPAGYITVTTEALIKEANLTGASLLGIERQKLINARFRRFVAPDDLEKWDRYLLNVFSHGEKQSSDIRLMRDNKAIFHARIESIRMRDKDGVHVARAAISDITEQKKAEEALQRYSAEIDTKNKELGEALAKVRTLSSLLPICSGCKKIRDDKGCWTQLESYISNHTDTLFSHGLCNDCMAKSMEELSDLLKNRSQT